MATDYAALPKAVDTVLSTTELLENIILHLPILDVFSGACRVSVEWNEVVRSSPQIQQKLFLRPSTAEIGTYFSGPVSSQCLLVNTMSYIPVYRACMVTREEAGPTITEDHIWYPQRLFVNHALLPFKWTVVPLSSIWKSDSKRIALKRKRWENVNKLSTLLAIFNRDDNRLTSGDYIHFPRRWQRRFLPAANLPNETRPLQSVSWHRMYVTNPPITTMTVTVRLLPEGTDAKVYYRKHRSRFVVRDYHGITFELLMEMSTKAFASLRMAFADQPTRGRLIGSVVSECLIYDEDDWQASASALGRAAAGLRS